MHRNSILNYFFAGLFILLLSACGARKERTLFNAATDVVTDTIKQVYVVNDQGAGEIYYKIKVNDLLAVRNLQDREFGAKSSTATATMAVGTNVTSYQVDAEGNVNLPAIGKVAVIGLTRKEIANKLQLLYGEKLLVDPIIEVTVVNVKVTLLGEFNKQGNFLLERDNTTLIDILGEAGGINTKTADPKTLKIIRGNRSNPEIIYVNLNDINSLSSKKLILQNNDLILLQPTKSSALSEKLQGINNIIQPVLVLLNIALLIFTISK
ncbi:polysaccharide biosynthesis/export family protein [Pedobacter frigiditerrae]|uniref:polysaccharide biosynthesis/export family protein n=1 Tax=Pedobacter frigiditerrae TaxID=2530452 RepID=UPI002931DF25|nr:polysaccharide biosynthesis/export family protein [Pedobacter frigiditerrae]